MDVKTLAYKIVQQSIGEAPTKKKQPNCGAQTKAGRSSHARET